MSYDTIIRNIAKQTQHPESSEKILVDMCAVYADGLITEYTFKIVLRDYFMCEIIDVYPSEKRNKINHIVHELLKMVEPYREKKKNGGA